MQHNIDIVRRIFRRNVDEPKSQTLADEIDYQRPVFVPIAISANHGQGRPDCFEIERDGRFANVAEMPDLVGCRGEIENCLRKFVVSISEDENSHSAKTPITKPQTPRKLQCPRRQAFPVRSPFGFLDFGFLDLFGTWGFGFGASGALPALQPSVISYVI